MRLSIIIVGCLAAAVAAPIWAKTDAIERERSERFARCTVSRAPSLVERGLAENWAPEKFLSDMKGIDVRKCMDGIPALAMHLPDLRYLLAAEWLKHSAVLQRPSDFSKVPRLDHTPVHALVLRRLIPGQTSEGSNAEEVTPDDRDKLFFEVGECVVRADSGKAREFLSGGQRIGPTALVVPLLSRCVPANTQLRLSPAELTGLIALSYARLTLAAKRGGGIMQKRAE